MDALTSAAGGLGLAISALLVVLGFRFARPGGGAGWLAFAGYGAAVAVTFGSGLGSDPGATLRLAGGAGLVAGLLLAGRFRAGPALHAGLALVLVGHLLRNPSRAGAVATTAALLLQAWIGLRNRRGASGASGSR